MSAESGFAAIARLLGELERAPDNAGRERARALVAALLDVHGAGLAQVLAIAGDADPALARRFADDGAIAPLLMLHGLHPQPLEERVRECVGRLAPRIAAQNARLELLGVDAGGRVRLSLVHHGKTGTLREEIEEALSRDAADASDISIEESSEAVVQLDRLRRGAAG